MLVKILETKDKGFFVEDECGIWQGYCDEFIFFNDCVTNNEPIGIDCEEFWHVDKSILIRNCTK